MARGYHDREYELSEVEVGHRAALGRYELQYHLRMGNSVNESYWIHAGPGGLYSWPGPDEVEDCETVHRGAPEVRPASA
jgi:hypothetical protein